MSSLARLRDRGHWTRAAITALLAEGTHNRSAIARRLGLTPQAVSAQVQELLADGFVDETDGLRVTIRGVERLHQDGDDLAAALAALRAPVERQDAVSAAAARHVRAGEAVGLWMRNGDLVADEPGPCHGVAENSARTGEEVRVRGIHGIVPLEPGTVHVLRIPEPRDGGVAATDVAAITPQGLVAAVGTGATIVGKRIGLDIAFAGAEAARNAAQRGLDVTLLVSGDQVADALRTLESGRVAVRVQDAPTK